MTQERNAQGQRAAPARPVPVAAGRDGVSVVPRPYGIALADRPTIQRMTAVDEAEAPEPDVSEPVGTTASAAPPPPPEDAPAGVRAALESVGEPLDSSTRAVMEPRFGVPLGDVRIHQGSIAVRAARVLGARAFTTGQHIVFGAAAYQPGTVDGRRLIAHELAHTIQQSRGPRTTGLPVVDERHYEREADAAAAQVLAGARVGRLSPTAAGLSIQREPAKDAPIVFQLGSGLVMTQDTSARTQVVTFNDEAWVTISWLPGAPPPRFKVETGTKDSEFGSAAGVALSVESEAWITVVIDHGVEAKVLASQPADQRRGVAYDFVFMGTVTLTNAGGAGPSPKQSPPLRRVVTQQRAFQIRNFDELPKPPGWDAAEEAWLPRKVQDSFDSFDSLDQLQKFMKGKPTTPYAVLEMPDGRWLARTLDEAALKRLADDARRMIYKPEQFEKVQWYRNKFAEGQFQGLFIDGAYYRHLRELADRYFDDPFYAAIGAAGSVPECEVFSMGASSYGRKALTHDAALARWAELSLLDWPTVQKTETEPSHRFVLLHVNGVGKLHDLDDEYFQGRDAFWSKVKELDDEPDKDKREGKVRSWPAGMNAFITAELDRPVDNPAFTAALRGHDDLAQIVRGLLYTRVADRAQELALQLIVRAASQLRSGVDNDKDFQKLIINFNRFPAERQAGMLVMLGVPEKEQPKVRGVLGDPAKAFQLHLGNTVDGVSQQALVDWAHKNATELDQFAEKLRASKVVALTVKGPLGDSLRANVYKEFGFTLDPKDFPHRNKNVGAFPSPLAGDRNAFASTAEQLYVTQAVGIDTLDKIETILIVTGAIILTVVLVFFLNVGGVAIATYLFGEGLLAFAVGGALTGFVVAGAGILYKTQVLDQQMSAGEIAGELLWGIGTGAAFGALGKLLQGAHAALRIGVTGAAFFLTNVGKYLYDHSGKLPEGFELFLFVYENVLSFALMEAGNVLGRSVNERAGMWVRAKRMGESLPEYETLKADIARLNIRLADYAVRPQRTEAEAATLAAEQKELLARQKALVEKLAAKYRTKEDAKAVDKDLAEELAQIEGALELLRQAEFLRGLDIRPVGESQKIFEYKPGPGALEKFQTFFPDGKVELQPDGTIVVTKAGETDPYLFVPAGTAKAAAPATGPAAPAKVNINTATQKELEAVLGIGKATAEKIIAQRKVKLFDNVDELTALGIMNKGNLAKAAPDLTAAPPAPEPLPQNVQAQLKTRQERVLDRADRQGVGSPEIDAIRRNKLKPLETTDKKKLADAATKIAAAEKSLADQLAPTQKKSLALMRNRIGEPALKALTDEFADLGLDGVADAFALIPKGTQNLGAAQLRGVLHAHRSALAAGAKSGGGRQIDMAKFWAVAKGQGVGERNWVLETYAMIKDARIEGADDVLADMTAARTTPGGNTTGTGSWTGSRFLMELARTQFKLSNIQSFESRISSGGATRDYDIVLRDGTRIEAKNWATFDDYWPSLRSEFERDLLISGDDPAFFSKHRYIFRYPTPKPLSTIKALMRGVLLDHIAAKKLSPTTGAGKDLLARFDAETDLVTEATALMSGAVPGDAPGAPPDPLKVPPPLPDLKEKDNPPQLPPP